jgi:hypothetical protein
MGCVKVTGNGSAPLFEDGVRVVVELGVLVRGPEHARAALLLMALGGGPRGAMGCRHGGGSKESSNSRREACELP